MLRCALLLPPILAVCLPGAEIRHEAEGSSDSVTVADGSCSGGSAARSDKAWQPLLIAPVPSEGAAFTVWIRHRGGPLCLKARPADGAQAELRWIWDQPADWTWTRIGRYERERLGGELYVIRGDSGEALLDCLVLRSDDLAQAPQARR